MLYIGGIFPLTLFGPALLLHQPRYQLGKLHQISKFEQQAPPLADDDLWIRCDEVGPLRRHRAHAVVVDTQQEALPVPVVPLAYADELPSAERVKWGGSHAQGAYLRPETLQFVLSYKRLERGRFRLPHVPAEATSVTIDATELAMLLDGIDVVGVKRPRKWEPPKISAATPG